MNMVRQWMSLYVSLPMVISILALTVLLLYGYSATFEFVYDDYFVLVGNRAVHDTINPLAFFKDARLVWLGNQDAGIYRPLYVWQLSLFFKIFGLDPFYYHVVSVCVHLLNTLLVFAFAHLLFKNDSIAFFPAFFFAVYPGNVETVAWVTQQNIMFATAYALCTLIALVHYVRTHNKFLYLVSILLTFLAIFTKEQLIVLPAVVGFLFLIFSKRDIVRSILLTLPYAAISVFYIAMRAYAGGAFDQGETLQSGYVTFYTAIKALAYYIKLVVIPYPLTVNYDTFPNYNFADGWFVVAVGVLFFSAIGATFFFRRSTVVSFGIFWFFISLAPVSNLGTHLVFILDERFLYFGSIGILIALTAVFLWIHGIYAKNRSNSMILFGCIVIYATAFLILTPFRLRDWRTNTTLWASALRYDDMSYRNYINRGIDMEIMEGSLRAIPFYRRARLLAPTRNDALAVQVRMARAYTHAGLYGEALDIMAYAEVQLGKQTLNTSYEKVFTLIEAGRYTDADGLLVYMRSRIPEDEPTLFFTAIVKALLHKDAEVVNIQMHMQNPLMREHIVDIARARRELAEGNYKGTVHILEPILQAHTFPFLEPYFWLGEAYRNMGDDASALSAYQTALYLNINSIEAARAVEEILRKPSSLE